MLFRSVFAALMCKLRAGDKVVASHALFGSCFYIVSELLPRYGIQTEIVDGRDLSAWEAALAGGDLDRATQAAHRCRNDALMVGAKPLQHALTALEAATRDHDLSRAREALEQVRAVWPATREQLTEASRPA